MTTAEQEAPVEGEVVQDAPSDASNVSPEVTALTAPAHHTGGALLPAHSAKEMVEALQAYLAIQQALDVGLKDSTLMIQGKLFRKRSYWEAVATAFNLSVETITEERVEFTGSQVDGEQDYGWFVVARASSPSGRSRDGDGACTLSEKVDRDGKLTNMASEHNVRAHAHTRAKVRAISNLVGFGEVGADEVNQYGQPVTHGKPKGGDGKKQYGSKAGDTRPITEPQMKRLFAKVKAAGKDNDDVAAYIQSLGFNKASEITREAYDGICDWVDKP